MNTGKTWQHSWHSHGNNENRVKARVTLSLIRCLLAIALPLALAMPITGQTPLPISFSVVDRGGLSLLSPGTSSTTVAGYATVLPNTTGPSSAILQPSTSSPRSWPADLGPFRSMLRPQYPKRAHAASPHRLPQTHSY